MMFAQIFRLLLNTYRLPINSKIESKYSVRVNKFESETVWNGEKVTTKTTLLQCPSCHKLGLLTTFIEEYKKWEKKIFLKQINKKKICHLFLSTVICHVSCVTCHVSCVIYQVSGVRCHISGVRCHMLPLHSTCYKVSKTCF